MSTQLLTVLEAAQRLRTSDDTVWRAIDAGHLNVIRIGRSVRVSEADLEAFIASRRANRARSIAEHPASQPTVVPLSRRRQVRRYPA